MTDITNQITSAMESLGYEFQYRIGGTLKYLRPGYDTSKSAVMRILKPLNITNVLFINDVSGNTVASIQYNPDHKY